MYATGTDGLYRSTDGGLSWSAVPDFAHRSTGDRRVFARWPAQPYLLVGTSQSVYRSIDGGTTWARMQGVRLLSASPLAWTMMMHSGSRARATAFIPAQIVVRRGRRWDRCRRTINELAVSPAYAFDHTVFATASYAGSGGVGIYRTTDGGETWKQVRSSNYSGALAISPHYATDHTLYVLGSGVSRSTNGGRSAGLRSARGRISLRRIAKLRCRPIIPTTARSLLPGRASGACRPARRCGSRRRRGLCLPPISARLRLRPATRRATRC